MTRHFNKTEQKGKRKLLRKNMPSAEIILWSRLKSRQMLGYKFRRQYSVDHYILDFYCPELKLAVEIDGESHFNAHGRKENDLKRQRFIESFGIQFVRYTNNEIVENIAGVLQNLSTAVKERSKELSRGNNQIIV